MPEYSYGWKMFSGKRYDLASSNPTMRIAQTSAKNYRKQGFNARVVTKKSDGRTFYAVYVRDARR